MHPAMYELVLAGCEFSGQAESCQRYYDKAFQFGLCSLQKRVLAAWGSASEAERAGQSRGTGAVCNSRMCKEAELCALEIARVRVNEAEVPF